VNDLIASNKRRTVFLMFGFVVFLVVVGLAVGTLMGNGVTGTAIALAISAVMAMTSYWKSDKIALAVSRAVPADVNEYRRLHNLVEGLCIAGGLPSFMTMPRMHSLLDVTRRMQQSQSPPGCSIK
jgi:heat shock protein HtpX